MKTSETVARLALYASACCKEELLFDRNDKFSRCPVCERLCDWEYIEAVVSWTELEEGTQSAA
jgi:hypothetical protein